MGRIYTEETLIRYYYSETDLFETLEIEHALEEDIDLRFEFGMVKDTLGLLNTPLYSPSQKTISTIMAYAKN